MLRRALPLLALPLLDLSALARADGLLTTEQAMALLAPPAPGLNIYMRHSITDRSQADTGRLHDRAGQRNLSPAGEALARALGEGLRRRGVQVAEALTSPVYRAQDTARLAFGDARIHPALVADDYAHRDPAQDAAEVSALLARPAPGHRVMVGHIVPLGLILGRGLSQAEFPEGSLALFLPDSGRWRHLGVVRAEALT
ncbi:histidine phosphatase family protein [Rhodovarius crocodyli]|uniref:histidine phosphatase family protein n=1 Tax=Rhodovarius crocodyli TaxID=1979269 RepID=UPI0019815B6B|nr:histidine phosphatase family protein [Rhodovarius crocodyli]